MVVSVDMFGEDRRKVLQEEKEIKEDDDEDVFEFCGSKLSSVCELLLKKTGSFDEPARKAPYNGVRRVKQNDRMATVSGDSKYSGTKKKKKRLVAVNDDDSAKKSQNCPFENEKNKKEDMHWDDSHGRHSPAKEADVSSLKANNKPQKMLQKTKESGPCFETKDCTSPTDSTYSNIDTDLSSGERGAKKAKKKHSSQMVEHLLDGCEGSKMEGGNNLDEHASPNVSFDDGYNTLDAKLSVSEVAKAEAEKDSTTENFLNEISEKTVKLYLNTVGRREAMVGGHQTETGAVNKAASYGLERIFQKHKSKPSKFSKQEGDVAQKTRKNFSLTTKSEKVNTSPTKTIAYLSQTTERLSNFKETDEKFCKNSIIKKKGYKWYLNLVTLKLLEEKEKFSRGRQEVSTLRDSHSEIFYASLIESQPNVSKNEFFSSYSYSDNNKAYDSNNTSDFHSSDNRFSEVSPERFCNGKLSSFDPDINVTCVSGNENATKNKAYNDTCRPKKHCNTIQEYTGPFRATLNQPIPEKMKFQQGAQCVEDSHEDVLRSQWESELLSLEEALNHHSFEEIEKGVFQEYTFSDSGMNPHDNEDTNNNNNTSYTSNNTNKTDLNNNNESYNRNEIYNVSQDNNISNISCKNNINNNFCNDNNSNISNNNNSNISNNNNTNTNSSNEKNNINNSNTKESFPDTPSTFLSNIRLKKRPKEQRRIRVLSSSDYVVSLETETPKNISAPRCHSLKFEKDSCGTLGVPKESHNSSNGEGADDAFATEDFGEELLESNVDEDDESSNQCNNNEGSLEGNKEMNKKMNKGMKMEGKKEANKEGESSGGGEDYEEFGVASSNEDSSDTITNDDALVTTNNKNINNHDDNINNTNGDNTNNNNDNININNDNNNDNINNNNDDDINNNNDDDINNNNDKINNNNDDDNINNNDDDIDTNNDNDNNNNDDISNNNNNEDWRKNKSRPRVSKKPDQRNLIVYKKSENTKGQSNLNGHKYATPSATSHSPLVGSNSESVEPFIPPRAVSADKLIGFTDIDFLNEITCPEGQGERTFFEHLSKVGGDEASLGNKCDEYHGYKSESEFVADIEAEFEQMIEFERFIEVENEIDHAFGDSLSNKFKSKSNTNIGNRANNEIEKRANTNLENRSNEKFESIANMKLENSLHANKETESYTNLKKRLNANIESSSNKKVENNLNKNIQNNSKTNIGNNSEIKSEEMSSAEPPKECEPECKNNYRSKGEKKAFSYLKSKDKKQRNASEWSEKNKDLTIKTQEIKLRLKMEKEKLENLNQLAKKVLTEKKHKFLQKFVVKPHSTFQDLKKEKDEQVEVQFSKSGSAGDSAPPASEDKPSEKVPKQTGVSPPGTTFLDACQGGVEAKQNLRQKKAEMEKSREFLWLVLGKLSSTFGYC